MKTTVPTRAMREHPDLDQLKRQAKELFDAFLAGEAATVAEVSAQYQHACSTAFALHDAQFVLARSYGFQSWPKLKAYVDGVNLKTFRKAVRDGDLELVRFMLRLRPELIDKKSGIDDRPLHYAVLERRADMVRLLMEHGADPRAGMWMHVESPVTPLDMASDRGYEEIVAIIREEEERRGKTITEPAEKAPTDLMEAFRRGDSPSMLAYLAAHPELIHTGDPQNRMTPLHFAAAFLFESMAAWLLDHGANVNARSRFDTTPLDIAGCGKGCGKTGTPEQVKVMMETLLAHGAERTARWAVATGDAAWLQARHAEGALGSPIYGDEGLLSLAVRYDRPDILTLLLDLGFDPDERRRLELEPAQDSWGQPLRNCAADGKLAMAEMLLARGADPNAHIYAGGTPLFAGYGDVEMRNLLERHGGYLDAELVGGLGLTEKARQMLADEAAGTLRQEAIPDWAKGEPVAELLLIGGATNADILKLALEHIDRPREDSWWSGKLTANCGLSDLTCLQLLLERCDVSVCAPTILHEMAGNWPRSQEFRTEERVAKAAMLLDAGARLDTRDEFLKSTPLGWACRCGRVELVKLYLERGADPVEADTESWARPRAWAEKMKHDDVLAVLREATR